MIKAVPYSKTKGGEKFKEFLAKPFTLDMLNPNSDNVLFDEWRERGNLNGWTKYINDTHTLEFYPTYYTIKKNKPADSVQYMLSIPDTIDDFITDMNGFDVPIFWTTWIDMNFEPNDYLCVDEIKTYFTDLLTKMGKSHELL